MMKVIEITRGKVEEIAQRETLPLDLVALRLLEKQKLGK
jgi:hypothetical protein